MVKQPLNLVSFQSDAASLNNVTGSSSTGECFTKTKVGLKLDLTIAGHSCHCLISPFTGIGLSRDVQIMVTNLQNLHFFDSSLLEGKNSSKDHNWETNRDSNQWHEWPAIVKSNLKSILVFVKHSPGFPLCFKACNISFLLGCFIRLTSFKSGWLDRNISYWYYTTCMRTFIRWTL